MDVKRKSIIAILIAVMIWGLSFIAAKFALSDMGPFTLTFARFFSASLILLPFALRDGLTLRMIFTPFFLLSGLIGIALTFGLQNLGLVYTTAGNAALVFASLPAITVVLSVIVLKEHLTPMMIVGVALSTVGVVMINGAEPAESSSKIILGNILVLAAMICSAYYVIMIKKYVDQYSAMVITVGGFLSGALFLLPIAAGEILLGSVPHFSWQGGLSLLYLGAFGSALGFVLWNNALKYIDAAAASPFMNLTPLVGFLAAMMLGEHFTWPQILGGSLTLLGVWLCTLRSSEKKRKQNNQ